MSISNLKEDLNTQSEKTKKFKEEYNKLYRDYIDIKDKKARIQQIKDRIKGYDIERERYKSELKKVSNKDLKTDILKRMCKCEKDIYNNTKV